jgi:Fe-S cluster assembly iron-binding protein IscA
MITLDKISLQKFREQGVREVFVHLIKKGCEGTKVEVLTEIPTGEILETFTMDDGFTVSCPASESEKLDGSRITRSGEKWIFTSEKVTGRCGCGSSFRFAGDPAKAPKEFAGISILEAGTSHVLGSGNYFVYGEGITEISVTGDAKIFSLELSDASEIQIILATAKAQAELRSVIVGDVSAERRFTSLGTVSGVSN